MWLELTRAWTAAQVFERFEHEDSENCCGTRSTHRLITTRSANGQKDGTQGIPEPAIAHARGGKHPEADPAGRAPAVHPPHHPVIAALDVFPEVACDCHRSPRIRRRRLTGYRHNGHPAYVLPLDANRHSGAYRGPSHRDLPVRQVTQNQSLTSPSRRPALSSPGWPQTANPHPTASAGSSVSARVPPSTSCRSGFRWPSAPP